MNYLYTPIYLFNAINLNLYDKKTKKPSNKGLVADHTLYINDDTDHKRGWKFNGITLDKTKIFCLTNGLDLDKNKIQ